MGGAAVAKGRDDGRGTRTATSGAELGVGETVPEGDAAGAVGREGRVLR